MKECKLQISRQNKVGRTEEEKKSLAEFPHEILDLKKKEKGNKKEKRKQI